jgi:hypothetical protein
MLITTPLLKWYIQHGLIIGKIYQILEFEPLKCFADFVEKISEARRLGDVDPSQAVVGDTMKLIGNSAYGSSIMDKEKHTNVKYESEENKILLKINEPQFMSLTELEGLVEIESKKKTIKLDTPIQIGFFVLCYGKLRMLEFHFDFVVEVVPRNHFRFLEMDTDSAYYGLSKQSLTDYIPEAKDHSPHRFLMRNCCVEHNKYDRRKPGLFKVEATGDEMICLASKTYCLKQQDKVKFSTKGIQKASIGDVRDDMFQVLEDRKSINKMNRGFRYKDNKMFTYQQEKRAFSWEYWKRQIAEDGISTLPLEMTLTPWQTFEGHHIVSKEDILSPEYEMELLYKGTVFYNLLSLIEYKVGEKDQEKDNVLEVVYANFNLKCWITKEWTDSLEISINEALKIKHTRNMFDLKPTDNIYYADKHSILGCGYDLDLHFMFSPLEYTGRNLFGDLLKKHLLCL